MILTRKEILSLFSHLFDLVHKGTKERGCRKTEEIRNLFLRFFKELVGSNHGEGLGKVVQEAWNQRLCLEGEQVRGRAFEGRDPRLLTPGQLR